MPYQHYGNIGDIWKHLPLCNFIQNENPRKYIETNSAFPLYQLERTPRKEYGIFTYFEKIPQSDILKNSLYSRLIGDLEENKSGLKVYLGSPGLAMSYLSRISAEFIFFDIEKEPLDEIMRFGEKLGIRTKVKIFHQDSIIGTYNLLSKLNHQDFIHFDPYIPFEKGDNGLDYLDVFIKATKRRIKSMLWYGFFTLNEKHQIYNEIQDRIKSENIEVHNFNIQSIEMSLDIIEKDDVKVNPGIMGCGILVSNLSNQSMSDFNELSSELVKIYKGTSLFIAFSGDLNAEKIDFETDIKIT